MQTRPAPTNSNRFPYISQQSMHGQFLLKKNVSKKYYRKNFCNHIASNLILNFSFTQYFDQHMQTDCRHDNAETQVEMACQACKSLLVLRRVYRNRLLATKLKLKSCRIELDKALKEIRGT